MFVWQYIIPERLLAKGVATYNDVLEILAKYGFSFFFKNKVFSSYL